MNGHCTFTKDIPLHLCHVFILTLLDSLNAMDVTEPEIQRKVASWPFDQDKDTDVILTSCDNVAFYCHKLLLSLVSPVFNAMFTLPGDQSQELHDGRPCIPLAEADNDLYLLLSWCDPRCTAHISSLAELEKVLELADKYGMECIVKRVEKLAVTMNGIFSSNPNPVELFFISARYRLDDLARIAATQTLDKSFEELIQLSRVPVAKHITAYFLQNLLQYHINSHELRLVLQLIWNGYLNTETWMKFAHLQSNVSTVALSTKRANTPGSHGGWNI